MRYAIVSDVHANLQAWNAVLLDIRSLDADGIICLGDMIGYGPSPGEVLESLYANVNHFILGNHDAALCGKIDLDLFNDNARASVEWTRTRLGKEAYAFLDKLPLSLYAENFRCVHGDFAEPGRFNYIIEAADALPSWKAVTEPLLFTGHTHQPAIYLLGQSGTPHRVAPEDFMLEEGKRFLVNVGSVGQPRDGDARASYCLLDTNAGSVIWRRLPFDLDAYRGALAKAGLDERTSYFLAHDPRAATPPLRKMLGFIPPQTDAQAARNVVPAQELQVLRGKVRWLQYLAVALLLCLAAAGIAAFFAWRRQATRTLVVGPDALAPITAVATGPGTNLLAALSAPVAPPSSIPGWVVRLGNRYGQTAAVVPVEGGDFAFALKSSKATDEIRAEGPVIEVAPGARFGLTALFRKSADFSGTAAVVISLTRQTAAGTETVDQFVVKEPNPNQRRKGGWLVAQNTFEVPAGAVAIQWQIRGRFQGSVEIKSPVLERKN